MKINLLNEFEKRYTGNVRDTMKICSDIAKEYNLDPEKVADYIYINRYAKDDEL